MKKLMKFFGIVAVAAMSLTACQNEFDEQVNINKEGVTVDFYAEIPTRSAFGEKVDGAYPAAWTGSETALFFLNENSNVKYADNSEAGESAKFTVTFDATDLTEGAIYAFSPKGVYNTKDGVFKGGFTSTILDGPKTDGTLKDYNNAYLVVPSTQTPLANSVDEAAHALLAVKNYTDGVPSSVNLNFEHVLAYGKMTVKNFAQDIKSIKLQFPTNVAGTGCYCFYADKDTDKVYDVTNATDSAITLNVAELTADAYWFSVVPTGTLSGDITITITSGDNTYTKTLGTNGKLAFERGKVSNFAVDMTGIEADVEPETPADEQTATITFNDKAKRTSYSTSQQVWKENDIIVTNNKASSTSNVGDYANPARFYKNSELIVEAPGNITEIVFDCNSNEYASAMGVGNVSSDKVTVTLDGTETSYTCTLSGGQVRMDAITVTYVEANPNLKEQNIEWSTGDQTIVYGFEDEFEVPELEGAETTVTYESSNTNVATVSAEGVVALVEGAEGTATITATAAATDEFKKATANVTITIEKASINEISDLTWSADEQDAKTITLAGKHLDKVANLITINTPANFTVVKNDFTLTITPKQVNETEEAIENTLEIRIKDGETTIGQGRNVTLTQKGITVSGEQIVEEMTITATTGTLAGDKSSISWSGENFNIVNYKNTSNTAIRTSDSDHFRSYVGNKLTFVSTCGKNFETIVISCTSGYCDLTSATITGATAVKNSTTITLTCTSDNVSIVWGKQNRFNTVKATFAN